MTISSLVVAKTTDYQKVPKNANYLKKPALSPCASIDRFWDVYKDFYSFAAFIMSAHKEKYKIGSRYFFYGSNFLIRKISPDEAEYFFLCLETLFTRQPGNDNMKTRYFLTFLRKVDYANKLMHSWLE